MPGTAAKVVFSERQMKFLEELANSRTEEIRLVQRAKTILLAYQKRNNGQIGEVVGMNPQAVSVWRKRCGCAPSTPDRLNTESIVRHAPFTRLRRPLVSPEK